MQKAGPADREGLSCRKSQVSVNFCPQNAHLLLTGQNTPRDAEFDLENDQHRCLYGLFIKPGETFSPSDVLRTTKIFKNAEFFASGTPDSTQIVQGGIGDCWFLSALSSVATAPGLLDQLCVAVSICFISLNTSVLSAVSVTKV
jgi:hypothetical protein